MRIACNYVVSVVFKTYISTATCGHMQRGFPVIYRKFHIKLKKKNVDID